MHTFMPFLLMWRRNHRRMEILIRFMAHMSLPSKGFNRGYKFGCSRMVWVEE
jgi:hypothetical protein